MDLVIIKYNAGNIQSVLYALERIGVNALVTDDYEKIKSAGKVIFPGVGEASSAMRYLKEHKLDTLIKDLQQPVLGICLGMQLMCAYSEENDTTCLGIFDEHVKHFTPPAGEKGAGIKVPQIGWNNIFNLKTDLFKDLPENSFCYFVHGYYAALVSIPLLQPIIFNPIVQRCTRVIFMAHSSTPKKAQKPENRY